MLAFITSTILIAKLDQAGAMNTTSAKAAAYGGPQQRHSSVTARLSRKRPSAIYAPAFTRTATDSGITVVVHVDRTGVGTTRLVVSTTRGGEVQRITQIEGSLSELDPPVGPLPVSFKGAGPGREVAALTFPDAGDWSLELRVQTSAITAIAVATTIHVR